MNGNAKRPVVKVTYSYKDGDVWRNFSILSIWAKEHRGLYRVTLDRGSEKYPSINLLDAIKRFAMGTGAVEVSVESQRDYQSKGGSRGRSSGGGDEWGGGGDDLPF